MTLSLNYSKTCVPLHAQKSESIAFKSSRIDISSHVSGINPFAVFNRTFVIATFVNKIRSTM